MNEEIFELKLQGYCCSQIVMELGLRRLGKENPDLVKAMAGLCNGMWQGKLCGIVSAAFCLLFLAEDAEDAQEHVRELSDWFEESFGGTDCDILLDNNPLSKAEKCPMMLEAAFKKVCELLEWEERI